MIKKISLTILAILAVISLFLPYQEFKSMWADFDNSGLLNLIGESSIAKNNVNTGYQLIFPIFPVALIVIGNLLSVFTQTNSIRMVSIVLISAGLLVAFYLYFPLKSTLETLPNSLSRRSEEHTSELQSQFH